MNVSLRQLRAFAAGARLGSFSEAANVIGLTQPGYSLLIKSLETEIGLKLFDRTTRSVMLTPAGREFYARIERILIDLDEVLTDARDMRSGRRGRVVISALPSAASTVIPIAIGAIRGSNPGIEVTLLEAPASVLAKAVLNQDADFGFGCDLSPNPELKFQKLLSDRLVAVFPAAYDIGELDEVTWDMLAEMPFVFFNETTSLRQYVDRALMAANRSLRPIGGGVTQMATAISLVKVGSGFTIVPQLALSTLNLAGVNVRPIVEPVAVRSLGILSAAKRSASPASQFAQQALVAACQSYSKDRLALASDPGL